MKGERRRMFTESTRHDVVKAVARIVHALSGNSESVHAAEVMANLVPTVASASPPSSYDPRSRNQRVFPENESAQERLQRQKDLCFEEIEFYVGNMFNKIVSHREDDPSPLKPRNYQPPVCMPAGVT